MPGIFDWSFGTNAGFVELIAGSGSAPNIVPELVTFVITHKGRTTWFLRMGLRHIYTLWQRALVLVQFPAVQTLLASFGTVPTVCCSRPADLTG